ncbi:MAG: HAD-IA family hydrolase [Burkholderiales bacterium]|nr:HAD-IA family hydrolase [Burkholderiales bacterium]
MIRAVLFDLDGTLADTAADLGYALNVQLQRHGRQALPMELIRRHASAGTPGLIKLGFNSGPQDHNFAALRSEYMRLYEDNLCRQTTLFPGIAELLDTLEERRLIWGIVTNKPQRFTVPLVKQLGIFERAGCVVSGDSVPRPKPHPDSLCQAAKELAIEPEQALYVGDDERDMQAATAAGMPKIIAGYGYLSDGSHPENWGAPIINYPAQVLNFL